MKATLESYKSEEMSKNYRTMSYNHWDQPYVNFPEHIVMDSMTDVVATQVFTPVTDTDYICTYFQQIQKREVAL